MEEGFPENLLLFLILRNKLKLIFHFFELLIMVEIKRLSDKFL